MEQLIANLFVSIVAVAMVYDLLKYRIPNLLSVGLVALLFLSASVAATSVNWLSHIGAGAAILGIATVLFAFGLIGGGDAKLLGAISFWVGLPLLPTYLLLVAVAGALLALILVLGRPMLGLSEPLWVRMGIGMPRVFRQGEGVPYGLAIGAAALIISPRIPLLAGH